MIFVVGFLTFINAFDVRFTTKLQDVFMVCKVGALVIIIIAGIYHVGGGEYLILNIIKKPAICN